MPKILESLSTGFTVTVVIAIVIALGVCFYALVSALVVSGGWIGAGILSFLFVWLIISGLGHLGTFD